MVVGVWLSVFGYFVVWLFSCLVVCLEDSTTLLCSFAFGSVRTRSKSSRITPMRRILSFHGFLLLVLYIVEDFFRIVFAPVRCRIPPVRDNP